MFKKNRSSAKKKASLSNLVFKIIVTRHMSFHSTLLGIMLSQQNKLMPNPAHNIFLQPLVYRCKLYRYSIITFSYKYHVPNDHKSEQLDFNMCNIKIHIKICNILFNVDLNIYVIFTHSLLL